VREERTVKGDGKDMDSTDQDDTTEGQKDLAPWGQKVKFKVDISYI
jgi:hypothetical protein